MNRRELAKTIQAKLLFDNDPNDPVFPSFQMADSTLSLIFDLIGQELERGEQVSIAGFGRWKVRDTKPGLRRNPQTQEQVKVPASRKVGFYPAIALKTSIAATAKGQRATRRQRTAK